MGYMQISSPTLDIYWSKKHRITVNILFSPNDKKSFYSLEEEWSGVKCAKYSAKGRRGFTETKTMPVTRRKGGWENGMAMNLTASARLSLST